MGSLPSRFAKDEIRRHLLVLLEFRTYFPPRRNRRPVPDRSILIGRRNWACDWSSTKRTGAGSTSGRTIRRGTGGCWPRLVAAGQQTPIVVVAVEGQPDRDLVIDGYQRITALQHLGRHTVNAVLWPMM